MSTENVPVDGIDEELYVFPEGEIPTEIESVGPEGEDSDDDYGSMPVVEGKTNNENHIEAKNDPKVDLPVLHETH